MPRRVSRRRRQRSTGTGPLPDAVPPEGGNPMRVVADAKQPTARRMAAWAEMMRRGAGMTRDFIADSRLAARFKEAAYRPQGVQLWSEFTAQTALRIRGMRPTADTTLDALMLMLTDAAKPDPRGPDKTSLRRLCDETCHYVRGRRFNADRCHADPERLVSFCSPDPASGHCALTLCFDAEELATELAAFRRSGAARMRNPALTDPALDPSKLQTELDGETVEMLEWQVALWRERRALKRAVITGSERSILTAFVLPCLTVALSEMGERTFFGRLWKRYTPRVVKRAIGGFANGMLLLLTDPTLSTVTYLLTKTLRVFFCLLQFEWSDDDWTRLTATFVETLHPMEHFPVVTLLLKVVRDVCVCIRGAFSLGIFACLDSVLGPTGSAWTSFETMRKVLYATCNQFVRRFVPFFMQPMEMVRDTFNLSPYETVATWTRWVTFGFIQLQSDDATVATIVTIHFRKLMRQLYDDCQVIYTMKQFNVAVGLFLMFARRVTAKRFVEFLQEIGNATVVLRPLSTALGALYAAFEAAFPGGLDTLHEMILWGMKIPSFQQTLELAFTLVWELWWLVRCAWYSVWHAVGPLMGLDIVLPKTRDAACCLEDLHAAMSEVLANMRKERDAVYERRKAKGTGAAAGATGTADDPGAQTWSDWAWGFVGYGGSKEPAVGVDAAGLHGAPVDRRLTVRRQRLHGHPMERASGLPWYRWQWKQPQSRVLYQLEGWSEGPAAADVRRVLPRAVRRDRRGYDRLDWLAIQRMNQCKGGGGGSTWLGRLRDRRRRGGGR